MPSHTQTEKHLYSECLSLIKKKKKTAEPKEQQQNNLVVGATVEQSAACIAFNGEVEAF